MVRFAVGRWKAGLTILLGVACIVSVAACLSGTGNHDIPAPVQEPADPAKGDMQAVKLVTLRTNPIQDKQTPVEEMVRNMIKEKTGADIEVQFATLDQFSNKMNLMLAGEEQLDYVGIKMPEAVELYKAGAIISLNDLLDRYGSNLKRNINPNAFKEVTYNGQILGIPGENPFITGNVLQIRTDWLEKLGLPVPVTIEDFEQVMDAFVNRDPDGNGIKDTWGLSPRHFPMFRMTAVFAPFFMPQADQWWLNEEGKLHPPEMAPEFKDMMGKFIEWREKGWLWRETMTASFDQQVDLIGSNKVGAVAGWLTWVIQGGWDVLVRGEVPEANFGVVFLQGPGINKLPSANYSDGTVVITSKSRHPDVVMKFFDFNATREGYNLTAYGPEGVNYTVQPDGTFRYISEDPDDINKAQYYGKYYTFLMSWGDDALQWPVDTFVYNKYNELKKTTNALPRFDAVDKYVFYDQSTWASAARLNELTTYLEEHKLKVFNGEIPLGDWDSVMEKWLELGGNLLIEDKTRQFNEYMDMAAK